MKKIILSLVICTCVSTLFAQQTLATLNKSAKVPTVTEQRKASTISGPEKTRIDEKGLFNWIQTTYDFGKIKVNNPVTYEFTFTNSGSAPLVITSVQASCGCTVAKYSKDPIAPGSTGFVKATYNAAKVGVFTKTVTVNANTEEGLVQLTIKGEVVE